MLKDNEANILGFLNHYTSNNTPVTMSVFNSIGTYSYKDTPTAVKLTVNVISKLSKLDFIIGENLDNENFKVTSVTEKGIQYLAENPPEVKYD
nr:MAG TPA: hypothetical protein [Caudoviricetes sp.]